MKLNMIGTTALALLAVFNFSIGAHALDLNPVHAIQHVERVIPAPPSIIPAIIAPTVVIPMMVPDGEEVSGAVAGGIVGGPSGAKVGAQGGAMLDQTIHQGRVPNPFNGQSPPRFFADEDDGN